MRLWFTRNESLFEVKVPCELLNGDLGIGTKDDVTQTSPWLSLCLSLLLPSLLGSETTEHDGFTGSSSGSTKSGLWMTILVLVHGSVPEVGQLTDTLAMDGECGRVLVLVDEVDCLSFVDEPVSPFWERGVDKGGQVQCW